MAFNNEIEKTKKEIEVLTAKLALLEEIENHKTPCEKAYRDVYGYYPVTDDMSGGSAYNYGKIDGTNLTTIECVKEPKKCKVRYDYLMMREN